MGLPPSEVGRGAVRPGLDQQDSAAALGKLAGNDATSGAGADNDDVVVLAHAVTPR